MAAGDVRHPKTIAGADSGDPSLLQISDHNAAHVAEAGGTKNFFEQYDAATATRMKLDRDGVRLVNAPMRVLLVNSSTALSNHTTLTAYDKLLVTPAGSLLDQARITVEAGGIYSNTGAPSITLQMSVTDGNTLTRFVNSGAIVTPTGVTNFHWSARWSMVLRSLGAGSSAQVVLEMGQFAVQGAAIQAPVPPDNISDTADSTIAWTLTVSVGWSAASASNLSTLRTASIRVEPAGTLVF